MLEKISDEIHKLMLRGMSYKAAKDKVMKDARVTKLVDVQDLKSCGLNHDGSNPSSSTKCPRCGNKIKYDATQLQEPLIECNKCKITISLVQI